MTCRDEILITAHEIVKESGRNEFTILDIIDRMQKKKTDYKISTIRTHIVSRMCISAPKNHAVKFNDFERIGTGLYKII